MCIFGVCLSPQVGSYNKEMWPSLVIIISLWTIILLKAIYID